MIRQLWHMLEPVHAVLYYAPEVVEESAALGYEVDTRWPSYFALRAAPLGAAGLDPCEALVSFAAVGAAPVEVFASRQWTDEQWAAARERLAARGWVDAEGNATAKGKEGREEVERRTDELAAQPWQSIGPEAGKLAQLVLPVTTAVVQSGLLPARTTLGIAR